MLPRAGLDVTSPLRSTSPGIPQNGVSSPDLNGNGADPLLSMLYHGWNPDLPDPKEMRQLSVSNILTFLLPLLTY